ncbi:lytic transglycosylase domain-containing protein [Luteimonas deserti]|uniref:Lytic transglycosylase domain-containing protein n=1 Tax=Luteimonas deserti TaxID=2752306 RepID=A0A7Z0TX66_9GAMM|nr:lytic transglycosylase domain-containing protein [Luteimonas deserti]NYZ61505.1 lytic transglycosylase domain-containing protein [Luteimonas deserti]
MPSRTVASIRPPRVRVAGLLVALALAVPGHAQTQGDDAAFRSALQAAERGQVAPAALQSHPAAAWLEFAALRRQLATLPTAEGQAFLRRHAGQPVAEVFREAWLRALATRQDWQGVRAAWSPTLTSPALRCIELDARARTGALDAQWTRDAQAIWRSTGASLPDACDAPLQVLAQRGELGDALRWERFDLAVAEQDAAMMRAVARGLSASEQALASDYAAFMQAPHARAAQWPKTARSRLVASHGLARHTKDHPLQAEAQLPALASALGFTEADSGRVLYQAALWTVASYLPDSARLLARVPASAYDERLHEWRVREAMARRDWPAALAAIRLMGAAQRGQSRWTWFEARMAELTGDRAAAQPLYRRAAANADFHGFLAADRLGLPYALCPWEFAPSNAAKARIATDPGIARAMALYRIDRPGWATREWTAALERFDDEQRRIAVLVAQENGWYDRAVFGLGRQPDETRLYSLRFPLTSQPLIERESRRHGLDPAWVAAEIRAESTFNPNARSPADARGLMQVMPATGAAVARRLGMTWSGPDSLFDPATNVAIGTAYLREKKDMYGLPYVAIAAYNAGPTPTGRWLSQRPDMDPDVWIETISYRETREYVARVLAFSVIYDWRMYGKAAPLDARMRGTSDARTQRFACPAG